MINGCFKSNSSAVHTAFTFCVCTTTINITAANRDRAPCHCYSSSPPTLLHRTHPEGFRPIWYKTPAQAICHLCQLPLSCGPPSSQELAAPDAKFVQKLLGRGRLRVRPPMSKFRATVMYIFKNARGEIAHSGANVALGAFLSSEFVSLPSFLHSFFNATLEKERRWLEEQFLRV